MSNASPPRTGQQSDRFSFLANKFSVPAVLAAFFLQPDIEAMTVLSRLIFFSSILLWIVIATELHESKIGRVKAGLITGLASMIFLLPFFLLGVSRSGPEEEANDSRCLLIQRDMLSARPRMANPADVFQALGCKPQGRDVRIFVSPTNRERAAGKALPWGGYPPPR